MINLTAVEPSAPAVRVDWAWTVSVERVLQDAPDVFRWAD